MPLFKFKVLNDSKKNQIDDQKIIKALFNNYKIITFKVFNYV